MDEKQERKLRSAAVQERRMAALAALAVKKAEAKLQRFRETWEAEREVLEQGLAEAVRDAQAQAIDAELRAEEAVRAVVEAGLEPGVAPSAEVFAHLDSAMGEGGV
ncbi:hypothetical protein [Nonomuraea sp. NPDC023979]|uniref:hypothetical protein n=1 Tax=Nonomuraea sp. NPDC023979 TaxID=3154796 RepID=UPI0033F60C99